MLTVATPRVNKVALLRCRADAATVARERRTAAFGAHRVVRERQQVIVVENKRRASRTNVRPLRGNEALRHRVLEARGHVLRIIRTDRRRAEATVHQVVHETLAIALGPVRHAHEHREIRQEEHDKHTNEIHSAIRHRSTLCEEFCPEQLNRRAP